MSFVSDTFSGTDGDSLAGRSGWTQHPNFSTGAAVIASNRLRCSSASTSQATVFYHSGTPAGADYSVSADLFVWTNLTGAQVGVAGRIDVAASTFYWAAYDVGTGQWELYKIIGGAPTLLGSFTQSLSTSTTYTVALDMVGSTIRLLVDSVERVSVTDSAITAAGKAGVFLFTDTSNTTGIHLDSITADDEGGGAVDYTQAHVTDSGCDITILVPSTYDGSVPAGLVFYHHGNGEDRDAWETDSHKFATRDNLITAGYLLAAISAGTTHWGNDSAMAKYTIAHAYLLANYNVSKVVLYGQSMGGLTALRCCVDPATYPRIKGFYGVFPACGVLVMYDAGFFAAQILTAWSAADRTALVAALAGKDPLNLSASAYANIRYRFHASPDDTIVSKANNTDAERALLASATKVENSIVTTIGDHGDASNFVPQDANDFVSSSLQDSPGGGGSTRTVAGSGYQPR